MKIRNVLFIKQANGGGHPELNPTGEIWDPVETMLQSYPSKGCGSWTIYSSTLISHWLKAALRALIPQYCQIALCAGTIGSSPRSMHCRVWLSETWLEWGKKVARGIRAIIIKTFKLPRYANKPQQVVFVLLPVTRASAALASLPLRCTLG